MTDDTLETIRRWSAPDWPSLRQVWAELCPEVGSAPRFGLTELNRAQAGLLFERLVIEAFRLDGLCGHHAFQPSQREPVDGLLTMGWQGFLVESKYREKPVAIDPVYRLHVLVEHRPAGTLGLFFSASGFTKGALLSADHLKPVRVLMFNAPDLQWALDAPGRMIAMVRRKWALALKFGRPHLPIAVRGRGRTLVARPLEYFGEEWNDGLAPDPTGHGEPPGSPHPGGDLS